MEIYNVETPKGIVKCFVQNGVYHVLNESDIDKFNYEPILSIEITREEEYNAVISILLSKM